MQQNFIISLGTVSMASNTIVRSVFGLLIISGNALGIVATTMIRNLMGMGKPEEVGKINTYLGKFAVIYKALINIVIFSLSKVIVSIYSKNSK